MYILVKGVLISDVQDPECKGVRKIKIIEYDELDPPIPIHDLFYESFGDEMKGCGTIWNVVVREWFIIDLEFRKKRGSCWEEWVAYLDACDRCSSFIMQRGTL